MSYKNSTTNFTKGRTNPALVIFDSFQKGYKKSAGSSSITNLKASANAHVTIIEQQPALIRYNTIHPFKW